MIPIQEADDLLRPLHRPLPPERLDLSRAAGLILREDIRADRPYPPLDRVCMDGVAIRASAWADGSRRFAVEGRVPAGSPPASLSGRDACLEVATGAPCPKGADSVIPYESLVIADGFASTAAGQAFQPGQNVHPAGADCREGAILVPAGRLLDPPAVGIAASVGLVRVLATPRPRVAVLGTGDELVGPGTPPAPWQLRRSNTAALAALFAPDAETRVSSSGDAPEALAAAIESALAGSDALVLTGGVSAGRWDAVPAALAAAGIRTLFHKVAQRPGKPLWAGVTADGRPIFGLPGNPVAALICGRRYVTPLLRALAGRPGGPPRQVRLADPPAHFHLTRFLPVRLAGMGPVSVQAHAVPVRGSGDFAGLGPSDGFVEVPARSRGRPASLAPFRAWIPEIPYP